MYKPHPEPLAYAQESLVEGRTYSNSQLIS